jgi:hypothetical protein
MRLQDAWELLPWEFELLLEGRMDWEREVHLETAKVVSAVFALGGKSVSPLELIGEDPPEPTEERSPEEVHMEHVERMAKQAAAKFKRYLAGDSTDEPA